MLFVGTLMPVNSQFHVHLSRAPQTINTFFHGMLYRKDDKSRVTVVQNSPQPTSYVFASVASLVQTIINNEPSRGKYLAWISAMFSSVSVN